jgi:hypothetical protein
VDGQHRENPFRYSAADSNILRESAVQACRITVLWQRGKQ